MERRDGRAAPAGPPISAAAALVLCLLCCVAAPAWSQNPAHSESGGEGQKIFMQNNCFVCHGQQGFGGIGPAFRNDPFLKLSDHVIGQIILGRGVMPPFGDKLDDKQIAAVASYIRNSWGNQFGVIRPEQVAQIRRELETFRSQTPPLSQTTGSSYQRP